MALDPFRNVSKAGPAVWALARKIHAETRDKMRGIWLGRGWDRASSSSDVEHPSGRALDVITSEKVGQASTGQRLADGWTLVNWMIANAETMHIRHIIYQNKIWKTRYRSQGWQPLNGGKNKGVSARHDDHIHVLFQDEGGKIPTGPIGAAASGGTPSTPVPKPPTAPPTLAIVPSVSVANLKAARYADGPKSGTPTGPHKHEVYTMEVALERTEWITKGLADGHFGTSTVGDGSAGYGGTTGFQKKHSGAARPDGWLGKRELELLFKLASMKVSVRP